MSLPNYMGCLMEFCKSVLLYYTKMCFIILTFSDASQSLSREIYFSNLGFRSFRGLWGRFQSCFCAILSKKREENPLLLADTGRKDTDKRPLCLLTPCWQLYRVVLSLSSWLMNFWRVHFFLLLNHGERYTVWGHKFASLNFAGFFIAKVHKMWVNSNKKL
jgi:hypothetical protein